MAFNSTAGRAEYTATAGQTVFPFLFKIFNDTDIKVYQTPSGSTPDDTTDLLTLTTDYTVTIDGDNGGEITLVSGATLNDTIVLKRELPIGRTTEYQTSGDLLAETLNADQEYQTYLVLDGDTNDDRAVRLPTTDTSMSVNLPATQAGYGLFVNQAGTKFEYRPADEVGATLQAWISQAHQKTSDSYATEAEDVFVKTYTSDGDGTFTATDTTEYSALHWAAKAATFNPALYATLSGATFTGDITATNLLSGTYTPTISASSNIDTSTSQQAIYHRVGDIVTVSGAISNVNTTSTGFTTITISLPITSALATQYDLSGNVSNNINDSGYVQGVTATGTARLALTSSDSVNTYGWGYTFSYIVK